MKRKTSALLVFVLRQTNQGLDVREVEQHDVVMLVVPVCVTVTVVCAITVVTVTVVVTVRHPLQIVVEVVTIVVT